jgi:hypothetical protein
MIFGDGGPVVDDLPVAERLLGVFPAFWMWKPRIFACKRLPWPFAIIGEVLLLL